MLFSVVAESNCESNPSSMRTRTCKQCKIIILRSDFNSQQGNASPDPSTSSIFPAAYRCIISPLQRQISLDIVRLHIVGTGACLTNLRNA